MPAKSYKVNLPRNALALKHLTNQRQGNWQLGHPYAFDPDRDTNSLLVRILCLFCDHFVESWINLHMMMFTIFSLLSENVTQYQNVL